MRKTRKSELKQVFKRFSYKAMIASLIVTNVIPMATPAMTAFAAEVETYTPYSNSSYNWVVSADGNWQYDIVDGDTSKCIVKPYSDAMKTGAVVIPDSIDGYVPVGVYADAWADNTEITSVTLPDSITEIGENAFKGCTALESINLQNVREIGENAFNGCTALTSIEVGSLNDLHYTTFAGCSSLTDVKIGDIGTYHIYTYNNSTVLNPFSGTAVKNIELGNIGGVTNDRGSSYGKDGMFYGLTGLETIKMGDIPSIGGEFAFHNCTSLKSLTVGNVDKVTSINGEFFYESSFPTSLETLKFGDIGEIQNSAFEGLSSLTSFEAGNVGKIDTAAFAGGWRWNGKINGTITTECDFKFGEIGSIGYYAFANRTNLSDDNLTYTSVESINKTAFDSTQISLKTVTLNTNDGTGTVTTKSVVMGTRGANIGKAEWDGKVFTGWYLDEACTEAFNGQVLEDMTLYAGWINGWYYADAAGNKVTSVNMNEPVAIIFDESAPAGMITYAWKFYETFNGTTYISTFKGEIEGTFTPTKEKYNSNGGSGVKGKAFAVVTANGYGLEMLTDTDLEVNDTETDSPSDKSSFESIDISGSANVGETITVTVEPSNATVEYQWQISDSADGAFSDISGATGNSYSPTADDAGKFIRVVITGTGDYDGSSYTSTPQEVIDLDISINVSGTARVGNTLSVSVDDADAEMTYRWLRCASKGGVYAVVGTGSSYTLTEDDGGMYIKVIGTGTSSGGADIKLESEAVKVKKVINSIGIVGIPKVGEVLEVVTDPTDATGDIQWLIGDTSTGTFSDISGATDAEYTIASSDAGKWLAVKFTGTGDYEGITITLSTGSSGNSSSQTIYTEDTDSESIEVKWELESTTDGKDTSDSVTNNSSSSSGSSDNDKEDDDDNNNTGGSSSSGSTSSVGSVLKGPEVEDGVTGDYKWYYKDEDGNWIEIEGATGDSFTITEDYAGKTIKSEFKGTDKDGNDIYLYTTPVYVPLDGNGGKDSAGRIYDSKEEVFYTELGTDEVYAGANKKVEVYVSQGQSVAVRLPFQVTADGRKGVENKADFEIEVRANISGADTVKVIPESELELTTVGKNPIKATVEQDQTEFSILYDGQESLELGKIVNGRVTVHDLSAGFWEGYYNYTIIVEGAKTSDSEESSENIEVTP